jgi:apolipoprotein D and lipocalin family protein
MGAKLLLLMNKMRVLRVSIKNSLMKLFTALLSICLLSCSNSKQLDTVQEVDLQKYQGKWYEIARIPNTFEKGLTCVTANYTIKENGKITVLNEGRKMDNPAKRSSSEGTAWVPDINDPGKIKVSFFWPFAGDYQVIALDENYKYALVGSPSLDYLWILSRTKTLDTTVIENLQSTATKQGFQVDRLEFIDQSCN